MATFGLGAIQVKLKITPCEVDSICFKCQSMNHICPGHGDSVDSALFRL